MNQPRSLSGSCRSRSRSDADHVRDAAALAGGHRIGRRCIARRLAPLCPAWISCDGNREMASSAARTRAIVAGRSGARGVEASAMRPAIIAAKKPRSSLASLEKLLDCHREMCAWGICATRLGPAALGGGSISSGVRL